jgi:serine/threonine protein kinase
MLGTVAYMSPEQVRARELDARTDLFSFGTVLYEMATGTLPFAGESAGVILSEILELSPVPPTRINPQKSVKLEEIIHKALEKDRDLHYQHASDMRIDIPILKEAKAEYAKLQGEATARLTLFLLSLFRSIDCRPRPLQGEHAVPSFSGLLPRLDA